MHFCSGLHTLGWRLNKGLAGRGMRVKIKAGYGMTELLMAGCGIRICRWERDLIILTEGMRDGFKIV